MKGQIFTQEIIIILKKKLECSGEGELSVWYCIAVSFRSIFSLTAYNPPKYQRKTLDVRIRLVFESVPLEDTLQKKNI